MPIRKIMLAASLILLTAHAGLGRVSPFVTVNGHVFQTAGRPYYFIGANYWYGSYLGLEQGRKRGLLRLRHELDVLKANGVTNLRLIGGAEGSGPMNGVTRVGPSLQPKQGEFDASVLAGLDRVLFEMDKRGMKAVIFLSNNWEWSGGFQQYLIWNGVIGSEYLTKKPSWDELRDAVAKFYSCRACTDGYRRQAEFIIGHTNKITGKSYVDDPTIMAWEIANEPRPMRPAANDDYRRWIAAVAAAIRSRDKRHLITIGHEGRIGTQDLELYRRIHADANIDYLTIHIWPKNWGWFSDGKLAEGFTNTVEESRKYIEENVAVARDLGKPMVIEEFGLPRDGQSLDPGSTTRLRDRFCREIFSFVGGRTGGNDYVGGANFWAFGGTARPVQGQTYWKEGDELMGDPPMEEQGLNSVFDSDKSTLKIIKAARRTR